MKPDWRDDRWKLYVRCFDDRGDPPPPNNFRPELEPSAICYAGTQCMCIDEAWKKAKNLARRLGLKMTPEGREHQKEDREWAWKHFRIRW
jgi:hypothetical protein